jgi:ABC-type Fe3+-hydroxamate transport system substrate-binding protein
VTEIVYALGAESLLVGTTNQCDYPAAARAKVKVGDFVMPDVERIVAAKPSVVFVALPLHRPVKEKLDELRVPTFASDPQSVEQVLAEVESVARALGVQGRGARLAASMRARFDSLLPVPDSPSVYVEISAAPLMTVGGRTFVSDLVTRAGGRNAFSDFDEPYPVVDPELVAARRPDVILLLHPGASAAEVRVRLGWSRIPAVKCGRIIGDIDDDLLLRPGPRMVEGVMQLSRRLHPAD